MRKIVIIHDDTKELQLLQDYLAITPGVSLAGSFSNIEQAKPKLTEAHCDILMADLSVLTALVKEKKELPLLVCIGKESEMQASTIHKNIFSYLQAPFSHERIFSLIQNINAYMKMVSNPSDTKREYIFIKSEYKLIKINLADILFLSGLRDYTQVFLKGKLSPLTTLQNLKDFESKLPASAFIRVHRSYIISLGQVDYISRNEITIGTNTIPIGHAYRQSLDDMITKNS